VFDAAVPRRSAHPWRRHELLCVVPEFWASPAAPRRTTAVAPLLAQWANEGWPVIVRRPTIDDPPDNVPVGMPLPPAAGKQRIAFTVPEEAVLQRSLPPSLRAVRHAADPEWEPTIRALVTLGACHGVSPAAFGSLLWQYQTGLRYLSPQSDIDVLWPVQAGCEVGSLLAGIASAELTAPMRIDGEVIFSDGGAVNWRELHNALSHHEPVEILIKSMGGVRLVDAARLLITWQTA